MNMNKLRSMSQTTKQGKEDLHMVEKVSLLWGGTASSTLSCAQASAWQQFILCGIHPPSLGQGSALDRLKAIISLR